MEWSLGRVREWVAGGVHSVRECECGAVGTALCLALLFIWYCYRMGCEQNTTSLHAGYTHEPRGSALQPGGLTPDLSGRSAASKLCQVGAWQGAEVGAVGPAGEEPNGFAYCQSADRFSRPGEGLNRRLYHSLQEYAKRYTWAGMGRVHKGVRGQGRSPPRGRPSIQKAELFFLPDLPSAPFFSREAQKHDVELLERSVAALLAEFECVYRSPPARNSSPLPPGWKANGTPRGRWWTFYLVNQGTPMALNARRCPRAWRVLGQLRTFIANNVFGNACFSVLGPGASIAEHYGPTNVRLRCHLGLKVPPNCELVVGGEPQCWSEGSCLLFDDSFLHTAFHDGSSEDGPRVVFMVDLWHPNVAAAERQALDYIFSPGR